MALGKAAAVATSAIDSLSSVCLDEAPPAELTSGLKALKVAASKLEAAIARVTHHVDMTGAVVGTGSRDAADWLSKQTGTSVGKNRGAAALGAAMARSDELADAVSSGAISSDKAHAVAGAAADEAVDAALVESVASLPLNAVKPAVEDWRSQQHPDRETDVAKVQRDRRSLRLTGQADGMTRVDGLLDPQSAATVRSTLDAVMNESAFDGTGRTREQRCADSLTQLCHAAAKGDIAGGRSNAKLLVTVPFETITERANDRGRTHAGPTLDAASVRQLACDAGIHRVVTGPGSSIVDFGHENRLVSANQFSALVVRDRHCRWPGCTLRATWCDAHHIVEWADGGATDLTNLALLCHRHHQLSHQPGWTVTGTGARIEIHHPDGSVEVSTPPRRPGTGGSPRPEPPPEAASHHADPLGRELPDQHAPAQLTLA